MGRDVPVIVVKIATYNLGAIRVVVLLLSKEVCDGLKLPLAR